MYTLSSQAAIAACLLVFAYAASRIARLLAGGDAAFRYAWALTAAAFAIQGLNMGGHAAFSIAAYRSGPASSLWDAAMYVNPVLNHSRTFLLVAYCLVLSVALFRRSRKQAAPTLPVAVALMVAAMVAGGVEGWMEGRFSPLRHYTAVAVWDIVELLALMLVLFVGVAAGGIPRGLWACLAINAFVLALSVLWFAALSRLGVGGQWTPKPHHIHFSKAALYVAMIVVAQRQYARLRRGERLRGFFDTPSRPAMGSLHG